MRILVDPRVRYNYASYYIEGLCQLMGTKQVIFDIEPFKFLDYKTASDYSGGIAFVVDSKDKRLNIFICFEDRALYYEDRYEWCDVYGMVNPTKDLLSKFKKIVPIGPQFGITRGNILSSISLCLNNYRKGRRFGLIPFKFYLRDYIYTNIRRRKLEMYESVVQTRGNYIFHASTLWYNKFAKTDTNRYRGEFLKACKKLGLIIEGGLYYVDSPDVLLEMPEYPMYLEEYKDFIFKSRLSMDDYIKKTKESIVVFNTPSVCECHGWKLAEYLCMGKAIISTPLTREMPGEGLQHGVNVHFVDSVEGIYDAVKLICQDRKYREKLEKGAREYYESYLAPSSVVNRLIKSI